MNILNIEHISKIYGEKVIFDDVSLGIHSGDKIGVIGVNGTGKTTLLKIIAKINEPDKGQIICGNGIRVSYLPQNPEFPKKQSILEYVMDGKEHQDWKTESEAKTILTKLGIYDFDEGCDHLSGGQKKRVALARTLVDPTEVLILDEPTAVLTPQETEKLFTVMRNMKKDGKAIIIITHKLHEVLAVSDRVAVLRKGEYIGDTDTATASQQSLTDMMVGRAVSLNIDRPLNENQTERLRVEHLTVKNKEGVKMLDDVTFTAMGGEILGIAGIAGSGQKELLESISGLQKLEDGSKITYIEPDGTECLLNGMDPLDIIRKGLLLSFVPEDRFGMGLVGGMNIIQNIMLRTYRRGKGPLTDRKFPRDLSQKIVDDLEVVTPDINRTPIRRLSGGNVQKVLVGREIAQNPAVLMTAYAVRGLDINTSYVIYNLLTEQKMKGVSVIYVGEDLDVLLELCDRILVLCGGKVSGIVDGRKTTKDAVGLMMTKIGG